MDKYQCKQFLFLRYLHSGIVTEQHALQQNTGWYSPYIYSCAILDNHILK